MKYLWVCLLIVSSAARAHDLDAQRQRFQKAYAQATQGRAISRAELKALEGYPLYPYLEYLQLKSRLGSLPADEIAQFWREYPDSLLGDRLRTAWLTQLARRGRWDWYARDYTPQGDPELQCSALALDSSRDALVKIREDALALWRVGIARPPACDRLFTAMRDAGLLTDTEVWERILRAVQAGNPQLATAIANRYAAASDVSFAELLVRVHTAPAKGLALPALNHDSPRIRAIVAHGIGRLARQDSDTALRAWAEIGPRYQFSPAESAIVARDIALAAVAQSNAARLTRLDDVPAGANDDLVERFKLSEALNARAWDKLAKWTAEPPRGAKTNPLRWRYWHGRALEELGQPDAARAAFQELARERDYYGFLASDRLGQEYVITHRPVAPTPEELRNLANHPGMRRAEEWYRLGQRVQAYDELRHTLAGRNRRDLEVAAKLVYDWGWYDRAIGLLGEIQSYDDLDLRFPLLHKALVLRFAKARELPPAMVYSIIRGESAFFSDAKSPTGALGLMQVMPRTGEETARKIGLPLASPRQLTRIDTNIAIGSEYLRRVLQQFGGSFPLAAAAYNAGPSRVRAWLATAECTPPDVWVDTIPFAETEAYVRRALYYAAIYEWRLGHTVNSLSRQLANMGAGRTGANRC
jgi:soluble lytic murein transglycosylase